MIIATSTMWYMSIFRARAMALRDMACSPCGTRL